MTFKKQYSKEDFLKALSETNWQKTREIAEKIGCRNDHVTKTLLNMPEVEWRSVKGGREGTREWKLKKVN
jgi:prolyl-tRNA editing enzyme YbaK/EbsC (Cys-tRNA(Pro) deacylase)